MSHRHHDDWILQTEKHLKKELEKNDSSHDWHHMDRVRRVALRLDDDMSFAMHPAAHSAAYRKKTCACGAGDTDERKTYYPCWCGSKELMQSTWKRDESSRIVIELAALLHDLKDWKYGGSDDAGAKAVAEFLETIDVPTDIVARVSNVVRHIGFKSELYVRQGGDAAAFDWFYELAVVQDADRLDAIGAIGIARCLTFGGARNRVLHDPEYQPDTDMAADKYATQHDVTATAASSSSSSSATASSSSTVAESAVVAVASTKVAVSTTIGHFYEKLLKLRDLMKTPPGQVWACRRHTILSTFLADFDSEWAARDYYKYH